MSPTKTGGQHQREVFSNNCGVDDWGLGILLASKQIRRITAWFPDGRRT